MKIPKSYQRFVKTCRALGVPVSATVSADRELAWDGKVLHLYYQCSRYNMKLNRYMFFTVLRDLTHLYHEMAHWVLASPDRRRNTYFGLDNDNFGDREEACASLLGISHARKEEHPKLLRNLNWVSDYPEQAWGTLASFLQTAKVLEDLGYMKNGKPTKKVRQVGDVSIGKQKIFQGYPYGYEEDLL